MEKILALSLTSQEHEPISYQMKYRLFMAFTMSFLMTAIMSGVIIFSRIGLSDPNFWHAWREAFLLSWPVALPTVFFISPIAQFIAIKVLPKPR